jgi:autotransporter-associated beta strand protein
MIGYVGSANRGPLRFDANNVTLTGTITMTGNSSINTNGNNQTATLAGPITESGGARSLGFGGGFFTLSGASTYTGSTSLGAGSITLSGGDNRLPRTTTLSLGATSKLVLGGNSQTLAGLLTNSGSGSVVGGNAAASALVLNITSGTNSFSGRIGGAGTNENNLSLRKQGAGSLVLSGTGSFTSATTIDAGVLSITGTQALAGTSGVSIAGGAGLAYTGGAASFAKNITVTSGTGSVTNSGGGLLTLSGTLTKDGTVLRLAGDLECEERTGDGQR